MINVAVVCRAKNYEETRQKLGWFSYPVPEFEWTFYPVDPGTAVSKKYLAQRHQIVIAEDWTWCSFVNDASIPIVGIIVDSNTSDRRLTLYRDWAQQCDVLLLDQDKPASFNGVKKPIYHWSYGVNEHVFYPRQKVTDIAYHVAHTQVRDVMQPLLVDFAVRRGYSITRGIHPLAKYAELLGQARIVVHHSTAPQCRSHRFFDALAGQSCLLTDKVTLPPEDGWVPGQHFVEYENMDHLYGLIKGLLSSGKWEEVAQAGYEFVKNSHTWKQRAAELSAILIKEYGAICS